VVQLRDKFTEISPQLRCKTERTVSDRAARDKACAMKKEKSRFLNMCALSWYTRTRACVYKDKAHMFSVRTHTHTLTCMCVHVRVCVCLSVCMCVSVSVCVCIGLSVSGLVFRV
jgi:hypothetical protein